MKPGRWITARSTAAARPWTACGQPVRAAHRSGGYPPASISFEKPEPPFFPNRTGQDRCPPPAKIVDAKQLDTHERWRIDGLSLLALTPGGIGLAVPAMTTAILSSVEPAHRAWLRLC